MDKLEVAELVNQLSNNIKREKLKKVKKTYSK